MAAILISSEVIKNVLLPNETQRDTRYRYTFDNGAVFPRGDFRIGAFQDVDAHMNQVGIQLITDLKRKEIEEYISRIESKTANPNYAPVYNTDQEFDHGVFIGCMRLDDRSIEYNWEWKLLADQRAGNPPNQRYNWFDNGTGLVTAEDYTNYDTQHSETQGRATGMVEFDAKRAAWIEKYGA